VGGNVSETEVNQTAETAAEGDDVVAGKVVHATKEDFDAGIMNGGEVQKYGVITLERNNLLENPSFEVESSRNGLADNWGIYNPSGGDYTTTLDTSAFTSGSKSQKITFASNGRAIYLQQRLYDVENNTDYTFSADVKIDDPDNMGAKLLVELWGDGGYITGGGSIVTESTSFTRLSMTVTATSDTDEMRVLIQLIPKFSGAAGTLWVDSAQLEKSNNPTPYTSCYTTTNGEYISPPVDMGRNTAPYKIEWTSSVKPEGDLRFQIRNASSLAELNNSSWYGPTSTEDYYARRANLDDEWKINQIHNNSRWMQYKVDFSTTDQTHSPSLHDVTIRYGASVPEIHWANVLADDGRQKYAFKPGETANFKVEVLDFKNIANIDYVNISIFDTSGNLVLNDSMVAGANLSDAKRYYEYSYICPDDAMVGTWKANIMAVNIEGHGCSEDVFLKIREPHTFPPQKMTLGVVVGDVRFDRSAQTGIDEYSKYTGLEIWKRTIAWDNLEPEHDSFDEDYINKILEFMDGAHENGSKVQISPVQSQWPSWVNDGDDDSVERYKYKQTNRLAETWRYLADRLKDHPALDSYLIINEETRIGDADDYIRSVNKVASSIRATDSNLSHRITIRPSTKDSYTRTRIAQDGIQDYDYGDSTYPTSWAGGLTEYESPISETSYLRMSRLRSSPVAYGCAGGVGEIGFIKAPMDTFGDEEKLAGFERAMSIAYDQGMDEFMIWDNGVASFADPETYFPMLKAYRDDLVTQPRSNCFDVQILIDNDEWFYSGSSATESALDMSKQPYKHLVERLDTEGYSWFYTHSDAVSLQNVCYKATINFSEIKGKSEAEQDMLINERLEGIHLLERSICDPLSANINYFGMPVDTTRTVIFGIEQQHV
jgi:hypothetical protein